LGNNGRAAVAQVVPKIGPSVVVPLTLTNDPKLTSFVPDRRLSSLGPHPLLAAAMAAQLEASGARRGDAVIMVAGECPTTEGLVDSLTAGRMLQALWGAPVRVAHLTGRGRRVHELVPELRKQGHKRVVAASYLLADDGEQRQLVAHAVTGGCVSAAPAMGTHPLVAELIVRRYRGSLQAGSTARVA
jgi:sirohydrochlorin ferrochelatase